MDSIQEKIPTSFSDELINSIGEILEPWKDLKPAKVYCDIPYVKSFIEIVLSRWGYVSTDDETPTIVVKIMENNVEVLNTGLETLQVFDSLQVFLEAFSENLEINFKLKSVILSGGEIFIVENIGKPFLTLYEETSFSQKISDKIYSNSIVEIYPDRYVKGKTYEFKVPLLTRINNILLFSDGSISDVNLTWNMKISNSPVDYGVWKNRLYVLDISGILTVVDLRTRNTIFKKNYPGAFRIGVENDFVYVFRKMDTIILDERNSEKILNQPYFDNYKIYPTYLNLYKIYDYYITFSGVPIGRELKFFYTDSDKIVYITEVGKWEMKRKE